MLPQQRRTAQVPHDVGTLSALAVPCPLAGSTRPSRCPGREAGANLSPSPRRQVERAAANRAACRKADGHDLTESAIHAYWQLQDMPVTLQSGSHGQKASRISHLCHRPGQGPAAAATQPVALAHDPCGSAAGRVRCGAFCYRRRSGGHAASR